jgi:ParB family chromosome partitioning protein
MAQEKQNLAGKRGLGRGLAALMAEMGPAAPEPPAAPPPPPSGVVELPVGMCMPNPHQPRRDFDAAALDELADSIRARGVLQPILVRQRDDGRYEIVAGERRWRAAQKAGLHHIPAVVRVFSDAGMFEAALIENVQREDLNPIEEGEGYRLLAEAHGMGQAEIAAATGKSRSHVANLMRVAGLPEAVKALVRDGRLSLGHAKVLVGLAAPEALAEEAARRGLSVRQLEARVKAPDAGDAAGRTGPAQPGARVEASARALAEDLTRLIGLPVSIALRGRGGTLSIAFGSIEQLDHIVERLQGRPLR